MPTGLWREPDFLKLWAGRGISQIGSQVTLLALPLTAIAFLGASPFQVGLLTALGTLPTLLFGLTVGVWVDRLRRRPLLIAVDAGRALLLLGVPIGALLGSLSVEYLCIVAFLAGTLGLVFDVASASFLPGLVGPERLVDAGGKLGLSSGVARIAGPGLAGALVQLVGAPFAIAADAVSFLVSALSVAAIRAPEAVPRTAAEGRRFWLDLLTGLCLVRDSPLLRPLIAASGWLNFWNSVLEAVWLLYLTRELGLTAAVIGTIFGIGSVGLLLGSATMGRVAARLGAGMTLVVAVGLTALTDFATPLVGLTGLARVAPSGAALVLLVAEVGFCWGIVVYTTTSGALRQASTPDHLRGRMSATTLVLLDGLTPVGALLGGALGQQIGLQTTLILTAGGELLAAAWLLASPIRVLRAMPAVLE